MAGAEQTQGGGWVRGVVLGAGGQIDWTIAQEHPQQRGAQQRQIAGAAGVSASLGVLAPGDAATVVVGAFIPSFAEISCEDAAVNAG